DAKIERSQRVLQKYSQLRHAANSRLRESGSCPGIPSRHGHRADEEWEGDCFKRSRGAETATTTSDCLHLASRSVVNRSNARPARRRRTCQRKRSECSTTKSPTEQSFNESGSRSRASETPSR